MKKLLIVLLLLIPSSGFTVTQTEIDAAKGAFILNMTGSKIENLTGMRLTQDEARAAADHWGMFFESFLRANETQKIWSRFHAPRNVATCGFAVFLSKFFVLLDHAGATEERKLRIRSKREASFLDSEGWTEKEIEFCLTRNYGK